MICNQTWESLNSPKNPKTLPYTKRYIKTSWTWCLIPIGLRCSLDSAFSCFACLCLRVHCLHDLQISHFNNFFIKNGSHDTLHTFKNYFVTIFSVFSCIQTDPKWHNLCHIKWHNSLMWRVVRDREVTVYEPTIISLLLTTHHISELWHTLYHFMWHKHYSSKWYCPIGHFARRFN